MEIKVPSNVCCSKTFSTYELNLRGRVCLQMQLLKSQNSFEKESSIEKERERRSLSRSKEVHQEEKPARPKETKEERSSAKDDVNFMMQVL